MQDGVRHRLWYSVAGSAPKPHSISFPLCMSPVHLLVSVSSWGTGSSLRLARASSSEHDQNPRVPSKQGQRENWLS